MLRPLALATLVATAGAGAAQTVHRNGFAGREPAFVRGDANVTVKETAHRISDEHVKTGATSELIKIEATPPQDATAQLFAHYVYDTPQAPVTDRLIARVAAWSFRPGVQVKARVVLPRERDPKAPGSPLTTLIPGDTSTRPRQWQSLGFGNLQEALSRQLPVLHARLGRAVDPADAYVDQIVVNVYTGAGVSEVWLDDLEIGPVRADAPQPPRREATPAARTPEKPRGLAVEIGDAQIRVQSPEDGELRPFFPLFARYTDTDPAFLKRLRDARLNVLSVPADVRPEALEEAANHGFWLAPTLPLPGVEWQDGKPRRPTPDEVAKEAEAVAAYLKKFLSGDAVLMWDLGSGRVAEDLPRVARVSDLLRKADPRRPRSVGLWDGFGSYPSYATAIEFHRDPLFSSLDLSRYRDWLDQRKALVGPGRLTWGWVQNHVPDWLPASVGVIPNMPTGPHPEQVRALTYLHLAAGHRGLGFWSDRAAYFPDVLPTDGCHGRDLYLEMWLLTAEIEMLAPVLAAAPDPAVWKATSDGNVLAAIVRGANDILVLPVWLGPHTQHCPPLATASNLSIVVPNVPAGAVPWLITPAGVTEIKGVVQEAGGSKITIPEFDVACAVVFTTDQKNTGKVVRWQDHTRVRIGRQAAEVAHKLATDQYHKTLAAHAAIVAAGGPEQYDAAEQLALCKDRIRESKLYYDLNQFDLAYREARRALHPLRAVMRADWDAAVKTLDLPTASPYAASYYTLPLHWPLAKEVACSRPGGTGLANGGFELSRKAPAAGARVDSLPGWSARTLTLDPVTAQASIVNVTDAVKDQPPAPPPVLTGRFSAQRVVPQPVDFRQPAFGSHCLQLQVLAKPARARDGTALPAPQALERAVVRVDTPACEFAPGQLVRVSFWVKLPGVGSSADGLVVSDTAGGEPLGARIANTYDPDRKAAIWKQYHLYRRVPATGKIAVSFALTGFGTAWIDEVAVEPLVGGAVAAAAAPAVVPAAAVSR
jgi:hypothetical protein